MSDARSQTHPAAEVLTSTKARSRRDEYGLTPVSYALLGVLAIKGPRTPYQLKQLVGEALGYFWSFSHGQIYSEPTKLVEAGLVVEEQEDESRRRRILAITDAGREAIERWIAEPTETRREIRDLGMLKLFMSQVADAESIRRLIDQQIAVHELLLDRFESSKGLFRERHDLGNRPITIEMGILFERAALDFWNSLEVSENGELSV